MALGVVLVVTATGAWWALHRPRGKAAASALIVYNGATGDASLVEEAADHPRRRTLPCVSWGRFAQRVGVHSGELVALDTARRAIARVRLADFEAVARGERGCTAEAPLGDSTPLHSGHVPYRGLFAGERLYVSYFSDNLVEEYAWEAAGPRFVRAITFPAAENLGLSEMAALGDTLMVTASGFYCFERQCSAGRFHEPHLFFVDMKQPVPPFAEAHPAERNTCGVRAIGIDQAWIVNAGDLAGGRSSVQRLDAHRHLGPEIKLPRASGAISIHALSPTTLAVLQMAGEHLFLIDAAAGRLLRILKFDGETLHELPVATEILAERSQASFQDLIVDPTARDRFYLVDEKGERLLQLRFDAHQGALQLLRISSLSSEAYHCGPAWGFFLDGNVP